MIKNKRENLGNVRTDYVSEEVTISSNLAGNDLNLNNSRAWIFEIMGPDGKLNNFFKVIEIHGLLDDEIFQNSLLELFMQNEFIESIRLPKKHLRPENLFYYEKINSNEKLTVEEIFEKINKEKEYIFDLEIGPLFRVTLIELEENIQLLLINMYHQVNDGWSAELLIQEIIQLYKSKSEEVNGVEKQFLAFESTDYSV